ncbi:MAG: type II toxin-antitoxin system HicA family toxin [Candidatus Hodarchaeota archaeon]
MKVLNELGWEEHHQRGSHKFFRNPNHPGVRINVPMHSTVSTGVIHRIIKDLGMTVEDFMKLV